MSQPSLASVPHVPTAATPRARPGRLWRALSRASVGVVLAALSLGCRGRPSGGAGGTGVSSAVAVVAAPAPHEGLLGPGDPVPAVEVVAHTGQRVRLATLRDKPFIVYFYPKDGTPGCTAEAQSLRDAWMDLKEHVSMVFGVSGDDNVAHREFASEQELPFLLLPDTEGAIAAAFGVPVTLGLAKRVTFLVGRDGKIVRVFDDVEPQTHARDLLAALQQLEAPAAPSR